jgi:RHS repeat-associated protein
MKANYTYNARGELVDIAYENSIARFSYEYDPAGRRISLTDAYGKHDFSYDASGQLTGAKWKEMGLERFGYDGSGNMLYNREYDFHYGPGNRLLGDTCGRLRFSYDDDGNMTEKETPDGVTRYQWDSEGRLIRVARPDGKVITYEYDDLGRQIRKKIGSSVWEWKYLGEDVIEENGPSGRKTYVHGPGIDEPLSVNGRKYFIADGLGSVRKIYGEEGEYRYTAFGKIIGDERGHLNAFAFTGREWDPDASLYYYRARWYDPQIGRFISEDPIRIVDAYSTTYNYAKNNPVALGDPRGLAGVAIDVGAGYATGWRKNDPNAQGNSVGLGIYLGARAEDLYAELGGFQYDSTLKSIGEFAGAKLGAGANLSLYFTDADAFFRGSSNYTNITLLISSITWYKNPCDQSWTGFTVSLAGKGIGFTWLETGTVEGSMAALQ